MGRSREAHTTKFEHDRDSRFYEIGAEALGCIFILFKNTSLQKQLPGTLKTNNKRLTRRFEQFNTLVNWLDSPKSPVTKEISSMQQIVQDIFALVELDTSEDDTPSPDALNTFGDNSVFVLKEGVTLQQLNDLSQRLGYNVDFSRR